MRSVTEPSAGAAGPIPERGRARRGAEEGSPGRGLAEQRQSGETRPARDVTRVPVSALTKGEGHDGPA